MIDISDKEQEILAEALIASVSNKKIHVICSNNEASQRLLTKARDLGVEAAIEIQVLRHDIGNRAEVMIIDEIDV